jgi:hypothetical protein
MRNLRLVRMTRELRAMATLLLVKSLLLAPVWILGGRVGPQFLALEAAVLTATFLLMPAARWSRFCAWVVGTLLVVIAILQFGDTAARLSLARPLNLYLDIQLVSAVANLLRGMLGSVGGSLVMLIGILAFVGAAVLVALLLDSLSGEPGNRRHRIAASALLAAALVAVPVRWLHPAGVVMGLPAVRLVREQSIHMAHMLQENGRFSKEMAAAPADYSGTPGILAGLGGRDIILAFVESYGMAALEDPRYAPVVRPRLEAMSSALEDQGLHVATGMLIAPSQGGMSWLGHGSVLSGLWLDNQLRYDLLLASDRETLVDDFEAAGYRTTALMPAITMAWPEGVRFGYEQIFARKDIDYAGPPLNWVTMPDQFTWSFLEETIRGTGDDRPLFVELGLISSHAPWTPILPVLEDWQGIGDGAVFQQWADAGEAPEVLWRDVERVREAYAMSVAYAVDAMAGYAARFVDDGAMLIALGDHQPAPLITGDDASRAVPVHVIAPTRALLGPFIQWGFTPGVFPETGKEALRMDAFRSWFVQAFSRSFDDENP